MTRNELNVLLQEYAYAAQRYQRDMSPTGNYDGTIIEGDQDPAVYDTVEPQLWAAIRHSEDPTGDLTSMFPRERLALLIHRYNHDNAFHTMVRNIIANVYALTFSIEDVLDAAVIADLIIKEDEERNRNPRLK